MQFAFVHLRILDVCAGMLLKQQKVQLHEMAFTVLSDESLGLDTAPEVLAMHKLEACEFKAAAGYYEAARVAMLTKGNFPVTIKMGLESKRMCELIKARDGSLDDEWAAKEVVYLNNVASAWYVDTVKTPEEIAALNAELDESLGSFTDLATAPVEILQMMVAAVWRPWLGCYARNDVDDWPTLVQLYQTIWEFNKKLAASPHATTDPEILFRTTVSHQAYLDTPDFDRLPEFFEMKRKIDETTPDFCGTGKPYESGNIRSVAQDSGHWKKWLSTQSRPDVMQASLGLLGNALIGHNGMALQASLVGDLDVAGQLVDTAVDTLAETGAPPGSCNISDVLHFGFAAGVWWQCYNEDWRSPAYGVGLQEYMRACLPDAANLGNPKEIEKIALAAMEMGMVGIMPELQTFWTRSTYLAMCLMGIHDCPASDLQIPLPEETCVGAYRCKGSPIRLFDVNYQAAEFLLSADRFDEAMAHAKHFEAHCWGQQVPTFAPWLQGRIVSRRAKSQGAPSDAAAYKEAAGLFEQAHAAAVRWGSPTLICLTLQDAMALVPGGEVDTSLASRYEEACFELTMETGTPLQKHIESRQGYGPRVKQYTAK